jgi:hypothetical protein
MHIPPFILASDEDGLVKIAIFVVMAIVWGIAGLANAAKKASEQAKRRAAQRGQSPQPVSQVVRPPATAKRLPTPQQRMPASRPVPGGFAPSIVQRAGALAQMVAPAARKPSSAPAAPVARPGAGSLAPAKIAVAASVKLVPHGASPVAIRRWLRPDSLQKLFILTELLQPPKALRQSPDQ